MRAQDLVALLGRPQTDPDVESALVQHAVRNRPAVKIDPDDADGPVVGTQSWVKNSRAGIEFGFDDEAAWRGLDETEYNRSPMLLTQLYLYGEHQGVRPYAGELPLGLQLSDDRATVRQKMLPYDASRHSYRRDTWDTPGYRICVGYTAGDASIEVVLCMLREPPLPPLPYALAPVPSADRLAAFFGSSLDDPALRQALDPLGLKNRIADIHDSGEADFSNPYGLVLNFAVPEDRKPRKTANTLLASASFLRERELGARAWTGSLPCDLDFEDSPETAVAKLGRAPDSRYDEDFMGHFSWKQADFTLYVTYSSIENRLFRVNIRAPGLAT
ncbi:hypothetical protein [Piscinibacter sp. HJYY11]|uniref:hypothetical protein n=1 Tax=Piscinibacter sp. HJYY11 TaxID=2801333 RepID=UPI00191E73EC|nr:hypothetical protein [Piscinibacter sp. HJYY11]MBL0726378.1 hypothetical protein [Piscinibacter sp. HJYY11]